MSVSTGVGRALSPLLARARSSMARRVFWLTDVRRDLSGAAGEGWGFMVVLGREHYTERRRTYPIVSRRDLDAVLKQELVGSPPCLVTVSGPTDQQRNVVFHELHPGVLERVGKCVWLVPESVLVALSLPKGGVACVERDGFRYFVASSGISQAAGGSIVSLKLFSLAAGVDSSEATTSDLDRAAVRALIPRALRRLPADSWQRFRKPGSTAGWNVDWRPIASAAAVALVSYLAFASGYLAVTKSAREEELAGLGTQVDSLLKAQSSVETLVREYRGISEVERQWVDTHRVWQPVGAAWSKGALVSAVEIKDADLTIRGSAPSATDVLSVVTASAGVKNARFSAPVRGGRSGLEEFSITATLKAEGERG